MNNVRIRYNQVLELEYDSDLWVSEIELIWKLKQIRALPDGRLHMCCCDNYLTEAMWCNAQKTASIFVSSCNLFCTKAFPKPITSCQLDPWEHISVKFRPISNQFHSIKCRQFIVSSANWRIFCTGLNTENQQLLQWHLCRRWWLRDFMTTSNTPSDDKLGIMTTCLSLYLLYQHKTYREISDISCTKSPNLNVSRFVSQLSLCNVLKPGVKWWMKM